MSYTMEKNKKILKELRGFGEIEVIKEDNNIKGKFSNKGLVVILVGLSTKHGKGTYRFLNIKTKIIIYSRDIVWKDKYYGEFFKVKEVDKVVKMYMEFIGIILNLLKLMVIKI